MLFVILAISGTVVIQYIAWIVGNRTAPRKPNERV